MRDDDISPLDVFTEEMIKMARLCRTKQEILEKVIVPNVREINLRSGSIKDVNYWAYAMEMVITGALKR